MCSKKQNTDIEENKLPYKHCLNCGSELHGAYCHVCGQQVTDLNPTIRSFVMEYMYNAFMWDPKLLRTLWMLVSRPGYLTKEFLLGKFVSSVHPLKLNMFILFVFLTLFVFFTGFDKVNDSMHNIIHSEEVLPAIQLEFIMDDSEALKRVNEGPRDTVQLMAPLYIAGKYTEIITSLYTIEDVQDDSIGLWTAIIPHVLIEDGIVVPETGGYYRFDGWTVTNTEEIELIKTVWSQMVKFTTRYFPIIILLTVPFLSVSLRLVQHRSIVPYINHFIFSLHYTAFLELLIIVIYLSYLLVAPPMEALQWVLMICSNLYLTIAFRRVYGVTSWLKAASKAILTGVSYLIIGISIFVTIFIIACIIVAVG